MSQVDHPPSSLLMTGALAMVSDACQRCKAKVYYMEKVGPVNGVLYHRRCFTCHSCGHHLNLRNYFTNQNSLVDREVYCAAHHPRAEAQGFDAQAVCIRSALEAPNRGPGCNGLIRGSGEVPRVGLDALHIQTPLTSQTRFEKKSGPRSDKYHYPASMVSGGGGGGGDEKLYATQRDLELVQRKEEDRLIQSFRMKRQQEAMTIKQEVDEEWQRNLQDLVDKYNSRQPKHNNNSKRTKEQVANGYEFEREALRTTMTMKMAKKKEALSLRLAREQQRQTSTLVQKHSRQMLQLIHSSSASNNNNHHHHEQLRDELQMELEKDSDDADIEETLRMLEEMSSTCLPAHPPPHPPVCRKRDLYLDPTVFSHLDQDAFMAAESEQSTFTDLVKQLTAHCLNDLEKARAIFRWITVKNLNVMEFDETVEQDTPFGILRGIKYGTETYHTLFLRLCGYAGLVCVEVQGHSKSVGYEPGMKIGREEFVNTWNAVLINDNWWPVQCNWGARHLVQNKDSRSQSRHDQIQYEYDDHYFVTDPDEFIREFWAFDPAWQLLDRPISLDQFENLPFVRSVFFHHGLEFEGSPKATLVTDSLGGTVLRIGIPEELSREIVFHYQLRMTGGSSLSPGNELEYDGVKLERFVFHTLESNTALFGVHVPAVGSYHLEIFTTTTTTTTLSTPTTTDGAHDLDGDNDRTSLSRRISPFRLKCSCKFQIRCNRLTSGTMQPLPDCFAGEWGPAKAIRNFGLSALTHPTGVIYSDDQDLNIRFRCSGGRFQIQCRLRSNQPLQGQTKVEQTTDDKVITINLRLHDQGQYGLDIFVLCQGHSPFHHACKYLINYKPSTPGSRSSVAIATSSPLSVKRWGPTPAFQGRGLCTVSHPNPVIELNGSGSVSIVFGYESPVKLNAVLRPIPPDTGEGLRSGSVTIKEFVGSKKIKLDVNIIDEPEGRSFVLEVFAVDAENEQTIVYNYVINNRRLPDQIINNRRIPPKGSFNL